MRVRKNQSAHDTCVEKQADKLVSEGFQVSADIKGWKKPPTIGGYIPDIYAVKDLTTRIVEVETEDTINAEYDIKQRQAFQVEARKPLVFFWVYIADDDGNCHFHG